MADDINNLIDNWKPAESSGNQTFDESNPVSSFLKDVAWNATAGMFGHQPDPNASQFQHDVAGFQEQHPGWDVAAALGGGAGFYGAGIHALEEIPKFNAVLDGLGTGDTMASGAARTAATVAPIELGRIGGAALTGGDVKQTAEEGAADTVLSLGLGGVGGMLRSGGSTEKSLSKLGLNIDMKDPPQVHLKAMQDSLASGEIHEDDQPAARAIVGDMKEAILSEELGKGDKYVKDLEQGDAQPINRLFQTGSTPDSKQPDVVRKRFIASGRDFSDPASAEEALKATGVSDDLDAVQFPRMLAFNSEGSAKVVQRTIEENLTSIGDKEYLGKEPDGLYVMAKKVQGESGISSADDRWSLFKTSDPQRFSSNAEWAEKQTQKSAWLQDQPVPKGSGDILDETQGVYDKLPIKGWYQATSGKSIADGVSGLAKMMGINADSEIGSRAYKLFKENFAPAMNEYNDNPLAKYLYFNAKNTFSKADSITHSMVYGDEALQKGRSVFGGLVNKTTASGMFKGGKSFKAIIDGLNEDDLADVNKAWNMAIPAEKLDEAVAQRMISPEAANALKEIDKLDSYMIKETTSTQKATGEDGFSPIKGHYLLPRTWEGTWRVPIHDDGGRLVYMASGKTKVAAEQQAEKILANQEVKGWYSKPSFLADTDHDALLAQQVRVGSPEYLTAATLRAKLNSSVGSPNSFQVRTGVQGYKSNFTAAELVDKFKDNVAQRNRYLAQLSTNKVLGTVKAKLGITDPRTLASVERRINSLAGRQGEVSRAINDTVDRVFAPALGKNSASTIARTINRTMGHLTIGAGNLQRPLIDALNFMQTTLPRIAFTINPETTDASLRGAYSSLPVIDRSGMVKGSMSWLSPIRIMKQSFQLMKNPTEELRNHLNQALHTSTIDEWIGHNSQQAVSLKKVLDGEEGYGQFLDKVSSFLPSTAWKLSRANSFIVGHILGKLMNLEGDGLFRFAKEFTDKTMYSYATADKPRLFTGPAGAIFGQFKNWTAHYIGNMAEYASEGYKYNNWSPLLWQMGGTTALGGISASALLPIGNQLSKMLSHKTLMENLYAGTGGGSADKWYGNTTDALWMGLPAYLGLALNGGMEDPASDPSRTASMMFSFVQANRAVALGKAMGSAYNNWRMTGQHPVDSQQTRDLLVKALSPKAFQAVMAQTQDDGMKSLNSGAKIVGNLNLAEKMMLDAGFSPKRIELAKQINEQLWEDKQEMDNKVKTMGRMWSEADKAQAYDVLTHLNREAMANGIPIDRIIHSAHALEKIQSVDQLSRGRNAQDSMPFQNLNLVGKPF